jgi:hypothetical protein
MSELHRRPAIAGLLVLGLLAAACVASPAATPPASATPTPSAPQSSPSPSHSPSPTPGITHRTGPRDLLLRVSTQGGFVAIELLASRVPTFSLYGDGRLIMGTDGGGGAINQPAGPKPPLKSAKLDETTVQEILDTALGKGGLATARDAYIDNAIMDAPGTVFEVHAGGVDRKVLVKGHVDESSPGPDDVALKNFDELQVYLQNVAATAAPTATDYTPEGFAGVLVELEAGQQPPTKPLAWPWPDLVPKDFTVPPSDEEVAFPEHDLAPAQVDALTLGTVTGAYTGITLNGPDGKRYSLTIRPLLPDQA